MNFLCFKAIFSGYFAWSSPFIVQSSVFPGNSIDFVFSYLVIKREIELGMYNPACTTFTSTSGLSGKLSLVKNVSGENYILLVKVNYNKI